MKKLLFAGLFGVGLILGTYSTVFAEVDSSGDYMLKEVTVTAEKRETNIQTTAVAISAFDADSLDGIGVVDIGSLQDNTPGMTSANVSNRMWSGVWIRGIGNGTATVGGDPGVAFHLDGVYQQDSFSSGMPLFDMERIEVLRGPQGTLYGKNATGGSINYVSKKPTSELELSGDIIMGNYDKMVVRGAINVPLIAEKLNFRTAWYSENRDGYSENIWTGNTADYVNDRIVRAHLNWLVTSDIDILLSITKEKFKGGAQPRKPIEAWPAGNLSQMPFFGGPSLPTPTDPYEFLSDIDELHENDYEAFTAKITWDLGSFILSSLTGYYDTLYTNFTDIDKTELAIQNILNGESTTQLTQEVQLTSDFEGPFEFVVGFYYFDGEFSAYGAGPGLIYNNYQWDMDVFSKSYAGFAQGSYNITEKFKVTAGARYTKDEKSNNDWFWVPAEWGGPFSYATQLEQEWTEVTWKAGIDYQLTDNNFLYASASRGYKGGGMNTMQTTVYDPEYILAYEIGSKNRVLDNHAEVNLSVYYNDYQDLQLNVWGPIAQLVTNAAEATIMGGELEVMVRPTKSIQLDGSVAYCDATFDEYVDDDPSIPGTLLEDQSGNKLTYTPELTFKIGVQYMAEIGKMGKYGFVAARGDYYWQDESYARQFNTEDDRIDSFDRANIRLMYDSPEGNWYAHLFVDNVTDSVHILDKSIPSIAQANPVSAVYNAPRTMGIMIGCRF